MKKASIGHERIVKAALEAVAKGGVFSFEDVSAVIGVPRRTVCDHFKQGTEERAKFEEAVMQSRRRECMSIRQKLRDSGNPTALIALYKLLGTDDERAALTVNNFKADVTVGDRKDLSPEEVKRVREKINRIYGLDKGGDGERTVGE